MSIFELTCNLVYDKIENFISPFLNIITLPSLLSFFSLLSLPHLPLSLLDTSGVIVFQCPYISCNLALVRIIELTFGAIFNFWHILILVLGT